MAAKNKKTDKETEINQNYEAFEKMLPDLLQEHYNKYALMRDKKIVAIYSTVQDAVQTGQLLYEDGLYSVQKITDVPADLGFFSHAVPIR